MTQPNLQLDQLSFAYEPKHPVLHNVNLCLAPGEFAALIGPNGSGKSTLLQCLAGILAPSAGRVSIAGIDLVHNPQLAKSKLGYAIDPARLPPLLTGREAMNLFAGARDLPKPPTTSFDLAEKLKLSPMLDRRIGVYSLGTRQKLGIVLGLLGQPPLLVLDEPLNGLDPPAAWALKQHLQALARNQGATVLLATHSLDVAERFINRALLLSEGRLHRSWNSNELDELRSNPNQSLEQAMVEALA